MSEPQRLPIPVMNFTGEMFAQAAEGAYQAMCAQLNILLKDHPEDEARLALMHDQILQARDMIAHQGQLLQKVYELARANQDVADKSQMAFARLEDAVVNMDSNNPYVARLIDCIREAAFSEYGYNPAFTDEVNEKIALRMGSTINGLNPAIISRFVSLVTSQDELLPEHIEEAFADLLQQWADEGLESEYGEDYGG